MKQNIQHTFNVIGKWGCYFLSILRLCEFVADMEISGADIIDLWERGRANNWLDRECTVLRPEKLLSYLTKDIWNVRKESAAYEPGKNEFQILVYKMGEHQAHFVLADNSGKITFDPWGDSEIVRNGKLHSKRIFWRS